jgi:UDP-3-O-[3-hydroxymyristoyl] glucosamine N-acyltransferase
MKYDIEQILSEIGINYITGNKNKKTIKGFSSLNDATSNDLSFCLGSGEEWISPIMDSNAGIILCKYSMREVISSEYLDKQLIFVSNPRLAFMQVAKYATKNKKMSGISPTAVISERSRIGKNCYIGNFTTIGEDCYIGDNTVINDKVTILQNTKIGKNSLIEPSVTIGADGFGFERYPDSLVLERFPHFGGVIIGDDVEICANTSVARGSLSNTVIGKGTKVDALVHIAHNVQIGNNCEITAGSIIGGSVIIGNNCWLGLNCTLKNKTKVGNNSIVACGATVINNVVDEDIVAGVPAVSIKSKTTLDKDKLFLMAGKKISIQN